LGGCGTYLNEILPSQIAALGSENVRVILPAQHRHHIITPSPATMRLFHRTSRVRGIVHLVYAVATALLRFKPEVVHAHSAFAGVVVRFIGLFGGRRYVSIYCPHGWAFEITASKLARNMISACERVLSRCCDRIVAISEWERRQGVSIGVAPDKLLVIYNGVAAEPPDTAPALWPDARRRILFVGRLDRQKGVDILMEAVRGLDERVCVRVVGEAVVARTAAAVAPPPGVELLGWQNQAAVARQMNASDLVVVPSRWEGFGLVAIEAMRAGKPVVAAAVGGLQEIVVDGVTGRLVPPEDVQALRKALLLDTDEELVKMGAAGREVFLKYFTSDRMNRALLNMYIDQLSRRQKQPGQAVSGRSAAPVPPGQAALPAVEQAGDPVLGYAGQGSAAVVGRVADSPAAPGD
jgi:glycosyltransferase involved in cell wall biosynthesis